MSCSRPPLKSVAVMIMPNNNFSHELKIPSANVNQFDATSSKYLWLETPGKMWKVELKRVEDDLFFGDGWRGFVEDNSIEANDLLYFRRLNGSPRVNVTIYCRKERGVRKSVKDFHDKKRRKHDSAVKILINLENENVELPNTEKMYSLIDEDDDVDVVFWGPCVDLRKEMDSVGGKSGWQGENNCSRDDPGNILQPVVENIVADVDKQFPIHEGGEFGPRTPAKSSSVEIQTNSANWKSQSTERIGRRLSLKNCRSRAKGTVGKYLPLILPTTETFAARPNECVQLPNIDGDEDIDEDIFPISYIIAKGAGSSGDDRLANTDTLKVEDTYEPEVPVISRKRKGHAGKRSYKKGPVNKKAAGMDKPKMFLSSYMVFMEEFRNIYKKSHPTNKNVTVVGRAAGEKWRQMSEVEKASYAAEALARKYLYYQKRQAADMIVEDKEEAEPKSEVNNENNEELNYMEGDSDKNEELRDDDEKSNAEEDKEEDEEVEGEVDLVEDTDFSDDD